MESDSIRECSNRTKNNGFKLKEVRHYVEILYNEGGKAMEWGSCGCPVPGNYFKARLDGPLCNLI